MAGVDNWSYVTVSSVESLCADDSKSQFIWRSSNSVHMGDRTPQGRGCSGRWGLPVGCCCCCCVVFGDYVPSLATNWQQVKLIDTVRHCSCTFNPPLESSVHRFRGEHTWCLTVYQLWQLNWNVLKCREPGRFSLDSRQAKFEQITHLRHASVYPFTLVDVRQRTSLKTCHLFVSHEVSFGSQQ